MASRSAMRILVAAGTVMPAMAAISVADRPTMAALSLPSVNTTPARASASCGVAKWQPRTANSAFTASAAASSTITACSEAQIMPLSKVLDRMMEFTAIFTLAVASTTTGVLPAPTPMAGLPEL